MVDAVTCSKCGAPRPPELAHSTERLPCPRCGATALTIGASITESVSVSAELRAELVPGNQGRDWRQRWSLVQEELQAILQPHTETMSGDAIHAAVQRLASFYILAYHLKDALKVAAGELGLTPRAIENAVSADVRLALLADLANLDKHSRLSSSPRSGIVPTIARVSGVDSPTGKGWHPSVLITHGASTLDGLAVAQKAVKAWQEKLTAWEIM